MVPVLVMMPPELLMIPEIALKFGLSLVIVPELVIVPVLVMTPPELKMVPLGLLIIMPLF